MKKTHLMETIDFFVARELICIHSFFRLCENSNPISFDTSFRFLFRIFSPLCLVFFFVRYGRLVQLCTGLEVMHILQYKCIETATKWSLRCILSISANNNNEQGFSIGLFAFFGCCFFHPFQRGYDNNLLKCSFQLLTVEYQLFLPQYINSSTRDIV